MFKAQKLRFILFLTSVLNFTCLVSGCQDICNRCVANTCSACEEPYLLYLGGCVIECPAHYYEIISNFTCAPQKNTHLTSSLILGASHYELLIQFDNQSDDPQFYFSTDVQIFVDNQILSSIAINKNSSSQYTITLSSLPTDALLNRSLYINVSQINADPTSAFIIVEESSSLNLNIIGIADVGSQPQNLGNLIGKITQVIYATAMLLSLGINIRSNGTSPSFMMIVHYCFLFNFTMMLSINYAPNLTRFYQQLPSSTWAVANMFKYALNAVGYSSGSFKSSAATVSQNAKSYYESPLFIENYGTILSVLIGVFVIWMILKLLMRINSNLHMSDRMIKTIQFLEWNIFISVVVGTIPLFVQTAFLQLYFLSLMDCYSYVSFTVTIICVALLIYSLLFLLEVALEKTKTRNWVKMQIYFDVLSDDFSHEPIGKKAPVVIISRGTLLPLLCQLCISKPKAQIIIIFCTNLVFFVLFFRRQFYRKKRLVVFTLINEMAFILLLINFIVLTYQDTYSFLTPKQQITVGYVIISITGAQSIFLLNYAVFDVLKKIPRRLMSKSRVKTKSSVATYMINDQASPMYALPRVENHPDFSRRMLMDSSHRNPSYREPKADLSQIGYQFENSLSGLKSSRNDLNASNQIGDLEDQSFTPKIKDKLPSPNHNIKLERLGYDNLSQPLRSSLSRDFLRPIQYLETPRSSRVQLPNQIQTPVARNRLAPSFARAKEEKHQNKELDHAVTSEKLENLPRDPKGSLSEFKSSENSNRVSSDIAELKKEVYSQSSIGQVVEELESMKAHLLNKKRVTDITEKEDPQGSTRQDIDYLESIQSPMLQKKRITDITENDGLQSSTNQEISELESNQSPSLQKKRRRRSSSQLDQVFNARTKPPIQPTAGDISLHEENSRFELPKYPFL